MDSSLLLEINNLNISFSTGSNKVHAVQDLSMKIKKGETLGIVGESGSGKSVTSLAVMGLLPPQGNMNCGALHYRNKKNQILSLDKLTEKDFQKVRGNEISMIFQEPMTSLNPVLTCGRQVSEVLQLHENLDTLESKKRTIQLFNQVLLPRAEQIYGAYPHQLSGGQKQRVMIAMAIACKPQLLIADEPTTALDVTVQKSILHLLHELQKEFQMGMIFISHDLGVISQVAQHIMVMYRGAVVEQGSAHNVLHQPQHSYTRGLLASKPPTHNRPEKLWTVSDFLNNENSPKKQILIDQHQRIEKHRKLYESEPLLQVQNLAVYFTSKKGFLKPEVKTVKAVDGVSFNVYKGETLGLVGESGCGKSTLGRSILRLIEPHSGKIIYNNHNLLELTKDEMRALRQKMQLIFQDPYSSLNPRLTIGQTITEPMLVHGIVKNKVDAREKAMQLLYRVGLNEQCFNRYPHEFSGGQRQRIGIARTLAVEPQFVVCDESVSALDVSVQAQVLNLLNELKNEFQLTYIFISHDLSVVKYMCDKIMVMKQGKIEEMNEADLLYFHPQSSYTQKLIEAIPEIK